MSSAAAAFLVKDANLQSSDLEPGKYEGIHYKWLLAPLLLIILKVGSESSPCAVEVGVCSGGFKLWECAVDLAQHLCKEYNLDKLISSKTDPNHDLVGKRVLELGCGQGLPGIVPLLAGADVHFQASPCRYSHDAHAVHVVCWQFTQHHGQRCSKFTNQSIASRAALVQTSNIAMTDAVMNDQQITNQHTKCCFQDFNSEVLTSLTSQNVTANRQRLPKSRRPVSARYFGGDWGTLGSLMASENLGGSYDIILSAETIYNLESQQQLFDCIKQVSMQSLHNVFSSVVNLSVIRAAAYPILICHDSTCKLQN